MNYEQAYQWLHGDRIEYSGCRAAAEAMEDEVKKLRRLLAQSNGNWATYGDKTMDIAKNFAYMREVDFCRGYYCAVAALLRESGCVTEEVRSLYKAGGGWRYADPEDAAVFEQHGLTPTES